MKPVWLLISLTLFFPARILAREQPAQNAKNPTHWPPEYMQNLPQDYLDRLHASLMVGAGHVGRLAKKESNESIGWVRSGMPALMLGQRVDEINHFFESEKFSWTSNPKFGFSLFSVSYMRMYAVMNDRTGGMKRILSPKAQDNFEKGMWIVAKANSKLSEAKRGVWDMEGSENHHLCSKSCDFLAAQFLRNIPAYANQKYDDGSSPTEQYEARRTYFLKWFDERAKRGQFVEAGSPSYQHDSLNALFNLRDFSEDPILRRKADMYLDLTFANIAEETLLTTRGGPKSRVKVGHEYDLGFCDRNYDLLFNSPGRTFEPLAVEALPSSNYYPPKVVVDLAKDTKMRGNYAFLKRWPGPIAEGGGKGADDPDGVLWRSLNPEKSVLRVGYATPSYIIGSPGLDPAVSNDASMGNRWQGVIFDRDALARIGFETLPATKKDWHGFNPFFSLQDRNILVTQKWAPVPPNPASAKPSYLRVYFSPTLDSVQEEEGWIFVKDGGAFAAVKVVAGGYKWTPAWKHAATIDVKPFVTLDTERAPVILIANQAIDYDGNFDAFKAAMKSQSIHYADGILHFAAMTFHGPSRIGEIDGKAVNIAPSRGYDSPFIRSDWNSGRIFIRKGDATEILDFSNPDNPVRTIGAPVTPEFPPGVGNTQPLILGRSK